MISVGTVLHDTYRIEGEIGRGAMGVVFRAAHLRVPRAFAVKVLEPSIRDVDTSFARFRREAEISSRLGHPNIVEVFDFNRTEAGQAYFVMELLEGHDLAAEVAKGPLAPPRVVELLAPVASALGAAHAAGVIHRDLKPSNIFIARKGTAEVVKVLDFGVSKILGALDLSTQSEVLVGTPAYMSPEQAHGQAKHVDGRADQFSLAAIAYELLSGQRPFGVRGETPYLTLYKIVNQAPLPLVGVPAAMAAVVGQALAKAPEARFADVAAFMAALAAAQDEDDVPAASGKRNTAVAVARESAAAAVAKAPSSRRRTVVTVALSVAAAGALGWTALARRHHDKPPVVAAPLPPPSPSPSPSPSPPPPKVPALPPQTRWSLVVTPPNARVVLVAADGKTVVLPGPWGPAARVITWREAERPARVRVEADGYESQEPSAPANGAQVSDAIKLQRRRRVPAVKSHHDLSYPWQNH